MSDQTYKLALVATVGTGVQLQVQREVHTKEEALELSDLLIDINRRQAARVNIPVAEAKIETLKSQIAAQTETIKALEQEAAKIEGGARKNGSGKVYTQDAEQINNYKKSAFELTVKLEQTKIQLELAQVELAKSKKDAGAE